MSDQFTGVNERTSIAEAFNNDNHYWGARFCKTERVTPWKLLWRTTRGVKQFTTTARLFPGKNPHHHADWDPYRLSQGRDDFGDWIRWHWAWRRSGFGNSITFLLHPGKDLDPQNPAVLLYRTVNSAVKNNRGARGHWGAMVSENERGSVIGRPKRMFMSQGAIVEHGGKWFDIPKGLGEEDLPILLDLGSDAAKKIIRICRERYRPEELYEMGVTQPHWMDFFKHGDPIGLEDGRFFEFYPESLPPPHIMRAQRSGRPEAPTGPLKLSPSMMRQRAAQYDEDDEYDERAIEGYTVNVYDQVGPDEYHQMGASLVEFADQLYERVLPWSEVLLFPSYKQQAEMIAPLLRLQSQTSPNGELFLDVAEVAWADHKDWLPDQSSDLWAEWVQRVSVGGIDVDAGRRRRDDDNNVGPSLVRRPPVASTQPGSSVRPPGREDETLHPRPDVAVAPAPPPVRRLRPGQSRPSSESPSPVTSSPVRETHDDNADHFKRMQEEEEALRNAGNRPNFPAPGEAPAPVRSRPGGWRERHAARGGTTPTTPAPPAIQEPQVEDDAGSDFTTPPVPGDESIRAQLDRIRRARGKINPAG
jgi:hypothetical protein